MELTTRSFYPILGFLLTIGFGFWLSRRGRPYNGLLFNVHKLIALGTVVLVAMAIYRFSNEFGLPSSIILLVLLASVSILALFASGAFMSANKGEYQRMKLVHNIAPVVLVISMAYTVYLLLEI